MFRFDKDPEVAGAYRLFHGEHLVATVNRLPAPGPTTYEVAVQSTDGGQAPLQVRSLRAARQQAEGAYIAGWLEGAPTDRGPVRDL